MHKFLYFHFYLDNTENLARYIRDTKPSLFSGVCDTANYVKAFVEPFYKLYIPEVSVVDVVGTDKCNTRCRCTRCLHANKRGPSTQESTGRYYPVSTVPPKVETSAGKKRQKYQTKHFFWYVISNNYSRIILQ